MSACLCMQQLGGSGGMSPGNNMFLDCLYERIFAALSTGTVITVLRQYMS